METAFDINNLTERLKTKGMSLTEDLAKVVVTEILDWVGESINLTESVVAKFMAPAIPMMKEMALKQVDKLDGVAEPSAPKV